jgi:xanthosine utilization system XapX-like protein
MGLAACLLWLMIGVSFIGWASDYSAIVVAVRNDGNSLSAISHRLIAPRTRTILFTFIFFYLLLIAGAFMGIMAALMAARPDVPLGIIMLAIMGFLAGQMLYKWKMDLIVVTAIVVLVTIGAMILGPVGAVANDKGGIDWKGPVNSATVAFNGAINKITGGNAIMTVTDPTNADPRPCSGRMENVLQRLFTTRTPARSAPCPPTCSGHCSCWHSLIFQQRCQSGGLPNRSTTSASGSHCLPLV